MIILGVRIHRSCGSWTRSSRSATSSGTTTSGPSSRSCAGSPSSSSWSSSSTPCPDIPSRGSWEPRCRSEWRKIYATTQLKPKHSTQSWIDWNLREKARRDYTGTGVFYLSPFLLYWFEPEWPKLKPNWPIIDHFFTPNDTKTCPTFSTLPKNVFEANPTNTKVDYKKQEDWRILNGHHKPPWW